ncbi:PSD1 and planctomycete cytochrome C domain-containing protein [Stieleria varia]|uniref:Planctomycete cytochrome C n=1 Tax=Stieleria varia TaxID=2528005 RepID=A0A5C6ARS8_9BACT|nr:PSD1 and planctomycete cytochrome C domain-containing protein [Stieleria varia]TWU00874.1 Planctomycete cytochrome C [Stieleria varia]
MRPATLVIPFLICNAFALSPPHTFGGSDTILFNRDIRPILSENCFHCHGPDRATRHADLRLDQPESAANVLAGDSPDDSELVRRILSDDPDEQMPPPDSRKALTPDQISKLTRWVEQGAKYQGHWAFISPQKSSPPIHADDSWSRGTIDRFVYDRLSKENLSPSPPADRNTLIRRITLDLTGLPPTPADVDAFVKDHSAGATERLIDRLMQSPQYGEHHALPWLEAARYADTDGYQNDRYRYQHVWRDWVIDAMNNNMPYDQFIIEQLAGDMLPEATLRQQIATGFGRNHRINSEDGSIPEEWRTEYVADRVDTFGTVFLGLTVGCARCHDHKYDPISQTEYYQLFAYFNNIAEWGVGPNNGNSPPFIEVPASWPNLSPIENRRIVPDPVKLTRARKEAGNGLQRPQAGSPKTVMVMHESDQPRETFVLIRGQYNAPDTDRPVSPGVPKSLDVAPRDEQQIPKTRLDLARWLTRPGHPLTARVAVNRLWQQLFGTGLVESSDNFGAQGSPPSHPELLDYLAVRLQETGWDLRKIEKEILLSATYQQSSVITDELAQRDPKNRLLARGPRVRMSAYMLRDQALSTSGLLVHHVGGPSAKPYMPPKIWSSISNNKYTQDTGANLFRRSLYTYWRRTIPPPTMMNFNAAAREVCAVQTESTNTPLQALTLMNNKLFVEAARVMAGRMIDSNPEDVVTQIEHGFKLATSRLPNEAELKVLRKAYDQFLQQYQTDRAAAEKLLSVGSSPPAKTNEVDQLAAMAMTASLIMNLDETITKE